MNFELNHYHKYIDKDCLLFHLQERGATLTWKQRFGPIPKNLKFVRPKTIEGCVYAYFIDKGDEYIHVYIGKHEADLPRHHKIDNSTSLAHFLKDYPTAKYISTPLFYGDKKELLIHESQFMIVFILAQIYEWSFRHFTPPFHVFSTKWPEFVKTNLTDKQLKMVNQRVPGNNFSKPQFDQMCTFPVVLKANMDIDYDWNEDPFKYSSSM